MKQSLERYVCLCGGGGGGVGVVFFFFNDTATTEIYTLSLHDALPIYAPRPAKFSGDQGAVGQLADANGDIHFLFDQIDESLGHRELDPQFGILGEKARNQQIGRAHV